MKMVSVVVVFVVVVDETDGKYSGFYREHNIRRSWTRPLSCRTHI